MPFRLSQKEKAQAANIEERIMILLSDGKHHHITEIKAIYVDEVITLNILEEMLAEEKVIIEGDMIMLVER